MLVAGAVISTLTSCSPGSASESGAAPPTAVGASRSAAGPSTAIGRCAELEHVVAAAAESLPNLPSDPPTEQATLHDVAHQIRMTGLRAGGAAMSMANWLAGLYDQTADAMVDGDAPDVTELIDAGSVIKEPCGG